MTTVQVRRDGLGVCGLTVEGHAGYAKSGSDIVCAAASVLITTCANALQSVAAISPVLKVTQNPALMPELRDFISLLRRTSNNFNQIARRVNSTDRIYTDDIVEMKNLLEQIWEADNRILEKLAAIN